MRDPFELSQEQTAMVMAAANGIAPPWRSRFLALVADELMTMVANAEPARYLKLPECFGRSATDDEVGRAIASACSAFAKGMIDDAC